MGLSDDLDPNLYQHFLPIYGELNMPTVSQLLHLRTTLSDAMASVNLLRSKMPLRCIYLLGHGKPYFVANEDGSEWTSREGIKLSAEAVNNYCDAMARLLDEIEEQHLSVEGKVEAINKILE